MPQSGRTTVAKALCQDGKYQYVDCSSWLKSTFRDQKVEEHDQQYLDEYQHYITNRLKSNPWLCIDNVLNSIRAIDYREDNFVIDGVASPKDFVHLFDYNQDMIVFLNRTDNEVEYKDCENIGVSVMRDYCFWMSSAGLIDKSKWIEYNFKIPGTAGDQVKTLGSKNSVFIVKSLNKVISHLQESLV